MTSSTYDYFSPSSGQKLKHQTARGAVWTMGAQGLRFVTTMAATAVLARLLAPADFGLVAMSAVFMGLCSVMKDFGLSDSTIQARQVNAKAASNLFWLNVGIGIGFCLIMAALAPVAAWVYGDRRLLGITAVLGINFLFHGFSAQHNALMRRRLRLKRVAIAEYGGVLIGSLAGIATALVWPTYWALVVQIVITQGVLSALRFGLAEWIPGRPSREEQVWAHMAFGSKMTATHLSTFLTRNGDNFLLGKYAGADVLGLYAKAYQLLLLPVNLINTPMCTAFLPALSRLQDDKERFRHWYIRGLNMIALTTTPIILGLVVFAEEAVAILLGPQWSECVLIFYCLAPAALISGTNLATAWVYLPLGLIGRQLRWTAFFSLTSIVAMVAGLQWGVIGVAVSVSITQVAFRVPELIYCYHETPLRVSDFFKATLPALAVSAAAGAAAWIAKGCFDLPMAGHVAVGGTVFLAVLAAGYLGIPAIRRELLFSFSVIRSKGLPRSSDPDIPAAARLDAHD